MKGNRYIVSCVSREERTGVVDDVLGFGFEVETSTCGFLMTGK